MAKAKQAREEQSVIITPGQARAVTALWFERSEIVRQVNEQIGQIMGALQEQGKMLAMLHELPRGDDWQYQFQHVEVDGEMRVKLTVLPKEQEPEAPPVEDPPPAEPEEQAEAAQEQGDGDRVHRLLE